MGESRIQAVAFDMGGVLFLDGKHVCVDRLSERHGYEKEEILRLLGGPESKQLRRGLITDDHFWNWVSEQVKRTGYDAQVIRQFWYESYEIDQDIESLIEELRASKKYRTVVFSGNIKSRVDFIEARYGFRKLFDEEVYSYDYGVSKPSRQFCEAMIAKCACPPGNIVYVDDQPADGAPAVELGVNLLIYKTGGIKALRQQMRSFGIDIHE
eukprot:TRINITY_DN3968_c2_g1_i1.p1 TRINITY_DN3968_c2_g1~~TRINITY_DN3968_c2_g1_i1.p1  ORF type:complete len:211 (+),score=21.08 TRINITY_DN3968_c2_g1_i1:122-754(+)